MIYTYKKEDVWLLTWPMRLMTLHNRPNDTGIKNYSSLYDLQLWAMPIPHSYICT